jgi:7-cyano-7-deazaguanine synthase
MFIAPAFSLFRKGMYSLLVYMIRKIGCKLETTMKALVLLSGGIDSAACASFYLGLGYGVDGLFVDYGQPASQAERLAASAVAGHLEIPLQTVVCHGPSVEFSGEIVGRNAFLVFVALLYKPLHNGIVGLGIHRGSSYYDCQKHFIDEAEKVVCGYTDGKVSLGTPFLTWSKEMVWEFCIQKKIPIQLTWSCEARSDRPCGTCLSCRDKEALHARAQ